MTAEDTPVTVPDRTVDAPRDREPDRAPDREPDRAPDREPDRAPDAAPEPARGRLGRRWWVAGIAIAALVVVVLAPLASPDPDGLERVAEDHGFIGQAQNFFSGLLGGYAIPGIDNQWLSTVLAGLVGVAIVVVLMLLLGRLVARRRP